MTFHNDRVERQTADEVDRAIRRRTESRISYFADHPDEIGARLDELDGEWDVERVLQANASTLAVCGTLLGLARSRAWFVLPIAVGGFLLQHSIQGWCPPLPVLRRLGFRTRKEIEQERYALLALRGDFDRLRELKNRLSAILEIVGIRSR